MKKSICFILSLFIMLSGCITAFGAEAERGKINISISKNGITKDETTKFGINLDGLTSANLIKNGSFEDKDNAWVFPAVDYTYATEHCINKNNPTYNVISVDNGYVLKNTGNGGIHFTKGEKYDFSCYVRNINFNGVISVWIDTDKNSLEITKLSTAGISNKSWTEISAEIESVETETGEFAIYFEGSGEIEIDCVSLVSQNSYGYDKNNYNNFGIRHDIFNALQNIKPSFITFSANDVPWKNTVGDACNREKFELGLHEYLSLCYDLKADAIPVINIDSADTNSNEFTNFKQDIVDMLEYANAPAETSYFGALRAGNGSVEPFEIKYVQLIGDSNGINEIKSTINDRYKDVTVLTENDITIIQNDQRNMGATIDNAKQMHLADGFVMYKNTFDDLIQCSADRISLSPTYYAQMLFSNNNGSHRLIPDISAYEHEMISVSSSIDQAKNIAYITLVNYNSSYKAYVDTTDFEDVTTASVQYVYDGYTSSYNDIEKQYIAPKEEALEITDGFIKAKIPENSVCVIRITYNNAGADMLYSFPENLDLKAKNYVPPAIIIILIALGVSFPIGLIAGNIIYKNKAKNKRRNDE